MADSKWITVRDHEGEEYTIPSELRDKFNELDHAMAEYNPSDLEGVEVDPFGAFDDLFYQYKR